VQIGRRAERIVFASLDPHAGTYLNAIGTPVSAEDTAGSARRVGIAIGPQYGTVDPAYIKHAVREAIAVGDIDLLCVMAFSSDAQTAQVTEVDGVDVRPVSQTFAEVEEERTVGRLRLLKVRMNQDLLMGEELRKTGTGNLFTVFGEPDIDLRPCSDGYEVQIRGIDVYDPTTGDVRSGGTDQLALWMIDTNYNEEAFFVRLCYFTGGLDPYKKLRAALKADIDPDAWESLTRTTSRPFPRPETGRIAVKVINDYGDEVMKVYPV
jgi:adenine-specific DNA-methyltransferase